MSEDCTGTPKKKEEEAMRKIILRRLMTCALMAAVLLGLPVIPAMAEEAAGSITVSYRGATENQTGIPLGDVTFELYRVGGMVDGSWKLTGEFASADVSLEDTEASSLRRAAAQLYSYSVRNQIAGTELVTNASGNAYKGGLKEGLYLIYQSGNKEYSAGGEKGIFRSSPFLVSIPMQKEDGDITYNAKVSPKSEWTSDEDRIVIGLRDLTIYTGGNEYTGELDGYPVPRYTGIPDDVTFELDGEEWVPSSGSARDIYPFTVVYTEGKERPDLSVSDTMHYVPEDTESGLYVAHIIPQTRGGVVTAVHEDGTSVQVEFETAILTVRDVLNKESNSQLGVIVSEAGTMSGGEAAEDALSVRQKQELKNGLAVVLIPEGSYITVNGDETLGVVGIEDAALLFDQILYYNVMNEETGRSVLGDRAAETLENMGKEMKNRQYMSRYLDLVQDQDGNLWLSSGKGCTVIWPYPEGTDKNTEFDLFHYLGLHREYGIKGNALESESVYTAPQEHVEIENTEYGIKFFIPESGFSPFTLSWVPEEGAETPGNGSDVPDKDTPGMDGYDQESAVKTGDSVAPGEIVVYALLCAAAVILIAVIAVLIKRRRKK